MIDINQSSLCERVAECNEFSEETAKTFSEAKIINPNWI